MNITSYADSWLRLMRMGFEGNLAGQDLLNFEISIVAIIMILLVIIAGCIQLIAIEQLRQHQAAAAEHLGFADDFRRQFPWELENDKIREQGDRRIQDAGPARLLCNQVAM